MDAADPPVVLGCGAVRLRVFVLVDGVVEGVVVMPLVVRSAGAPVTKELGSPNAEFNSRSWELVLVEPSGGRVPCEVPRVIDAFASGDAVAL